MSENQLSLESLKQQVDNLADLVKKNAQAIVDTGSHVLGLQVDRERKSLGSLRISGSTPPSRIKDDESDDEDNGRIGHGEDGALTNDDVVDLVTELQDQLDILDQRSVRRTANAFVSAESDAIAPLPGRDGVVPGEGDEEEKFPTTLKDFKALGNDSVQFWLRYYELLPPDEAELQDILKRAGTNYEELGLDKDKQGAAAAAQPTEEEIDASYDTLARFLGLRDRRTLGAW
ncbi:hypothetical protein TRVA0_024S01068 [Trichomonascus vanleenenianus]|uniref:Mrp8p n=1 Tax=Trichomonascus vanleenenianus TaxID=2268995 RepID=UPI003EC9953A